MNNSMCAGIANYCCGLMSEIAITKYRKNVGLAVHNNGNFVSVIIPSCLLLLSVKSLIPHTN